VADALHPEPEREDARRQSVPQHERPDADGRARIVECEQRRHAERQHQQQAEQVRVRADVDGRERLREAARQDHIQRFAADGAQHHQIAGERARARDARGVVGMREIDDDHACDRERNRGQRPPIRLFFQEDPREQRDDGGYRARDDARRDGARPVHAVEHQQRKPECAEQGLQEQIDPFALFHAAQLACTQQRPQHSHRDHETQQREERYGNERDNRLANADVAADEQHRGDEKQ